jgi:hypothetical protein
MRPAAIWGDQVQLLTLLLLLSREWRRKREKTWVDNIWVTREISYYLSSQDCFQISARAVLQSAGAAPVADYADQRKKSDNLS